MARARNIKPALFENEILGEADPLITLLFIGLWGLADAQGKLEYRPKRIKIKIFPYRDIPDLSRLIRYLHDHDFIKLYEVGGTEYIEILNFVRHQNPHKNEQPRGYPERPADSGSSGNSGQSPNKSEQSPSESGSVSRIPDSGFLNPDSGFLNDDVPETGEKRESPSPSWSWIEDRLIETGLNPITLATKHRKQFQQWQSDGVTLAELNNAITEAAKALAKKGETEPPNVGYIAAVVANARKQSTPVSAGKKAISNHGGFKERDYASKEATAGFKVAGESS